MKIILIVITLFQNAFSQVSYQSYPVPILIAPMMHIDPLPTINDSNQVINVYNQHRDAILWYKNLALSNGVKLSAQMTGVYAEACTRRGHWSDFSDFITGAMHHLGTHLHANVKTIPPRNYVWRTLPNQFYNHPDSVRKVFWDNLPWINQVFIRNGYSTSNNWFFHGTHAIYNGMDTVLFNYNDTIMRHSQ